MIKLLFKKNTDLYMLETKYKWLFKVALIGGAIFGIYLFYPVGEFLGNLLAIVPDIPVKEQENGLVFLILFLIATPILIIGGAVIGLVVLGLFLILNKNIEVKEFVEILVSSKFPNRWHKHLT